MLIKPRRVYRPFEYQKCFDLARTQQMVHWLETEIPMASDIQDWNSNLTESEKRVIGKILKGFTQAEILVGDYWRQVANWFPKPEVAQMASVFSYFECFDKETEILTPQGWKKIPEITDQDIVAQYNFNSKIISFTNPKKVVKYPYKGKLHHYKSRNTDICVTPNHDLLLISPTAKRFKKKSEEGIWGRNYSYPCSGYKAGIDDNITALEKLLVAIQADGSLFGNTPSGKDRNRKDCTMQFSKPRKIEELKKILLECNLEYQEVINGEFTKFYFHLPENIDVSQIKNLGFINIESITSNKAQQFVIEILKWDASGQRYYNSNKEAIDKFQILCVLSGRRAMVSTSRTAKQNLKATLPQGGNPKSAKTSYVVNTTQTEKCMYPYREEINYDDYVYCLSVETENLVTRRNGKVAFTGNTIHQTAYALLNDTLGLDDWEAFITDEETAAKLDNLLNVQFESLTTLDVQYFTTGRHEHYPDREAKEKLEDIATSLAIFSAFTEGVQIFSSFAVLLSFQKVNLMKGVGQIVAFSVRDETIHSQGGIYLFNTLCEEHPWLRDSCRDKIYEAAELSYQLEKNFIDECFKLGDVRTITKDQLVEFIKHRINIQLRNLGYTDLFEVNTNLIEEMNWFYDLSVGKEFGDFLATRGTVTEYSKVEKFDADNMW